MMVFRQQWGLPAPRDGNELKALRVAALEAKREEEVAAQASATASSWHFQRIGHHAAQLERRRIHDFRANLPPFAPRPWWEQDMY